HGHAANEEPYRNQDNNNERDDDRNDHGKGCPATVNLVQFVDPEDGKDHCPEVEQDTDNGDPAKEQTGCCAVHNGFEGLRKPLAAADNPDPEVQPSGKDRGEDKTADKHKEKDQYRVVDMRDPACHAPYAKTGEG